MTYPMGFHPGIAIFHLALENPPLKLYPDISNRYKIYRPLPLPDMPLAINSQKGLTDPNNN